MNCNTTKKKKAVPLLYNVDAFVMLQSSLMKKQHFRRIIVEFWYESQLSHCI